MRVTTPVTLTGFAEPYSAAKERWASLGTAATARSTARTEGTRFESLGIDMEWISLKDDPSHSNTRGHRRAPSARSRRFSRGGYRCADRRWSLHSGAHRATGARSAR